jgi:acetoin utilization protein AcuB
LLLTWLAAAASSVGVAGPKGVAMLVANCMHRDPVTISPHDTLAEAMERMKSGGFRRLPVVENGALVGMLSDGDAREHVGHLEHTKVNVAMTEPPVTVTPDITLEDAAQLMLRHKFGGVPVVDRGRLVGIVTASDVMQAFIDATGASVEGAVRIDLMLEGDRTVAGAVRLAEERGAAVLGVGTYLDEWGGKRVFYLRIKAAEPRALVDALKAAGYAVLGLHE